MTTDAALHAIVYDDDVSTRRAAAVIVERSGADLLDVTGDVGDVVEHVRPRLPDLIVLELALAGALGLGIVPALLAAVPGTAVILLSPFGALREAALGAGAYDLVDGDDLRELRRCVRRLVAERRAGEGQHEPALAVDEVTAVGAGESPGDGEAQPGATPPVQADEALEDPLAHPLGNS